MRNLKKILAMALALVMSLSLVTVANATDFTDDGDISYKEAVDVMSAFGVINGYEDGSFQPEGTLTREEAAKLICTMLLGSGADQLGTSSSSFTDVSASRWSAPFIEYCVQTGIISGNGDGTFDPTGELTGHAFAKMLLVALGYDSAREGYTGTGWTIEVAKDAVTAGIDVDGVALSDEVTREVAAQMCLNTLEATMVEYATAGTVVTTPDGTTVVTSGSNASKVEDGEIVFVAVTSMGDAVDAGGDDEPADGEYEIIGFGGTVTSEDPVDLDVYGDTDAVDSDVIGEWLEDQGYTSVSSDGSVWTFSRGYTTYTDVTINVTPIYLIEEVVKGNDGVDRIVADKEYVNVGDTITFTLTRDAGFSGTYNSASVDGLTVDGSATVTRVNSTTYTVQFEIGGTISDDIESVTVTLTNS